MAPTDIGLAGFYFVLLGLSFANFILIQACPQHRHRFIAIAVLRSVVLTLHDDIGGQMGNAHGRFGLVDVLATGSGGAKYVDSQIGRIDVDLNRIVDFGIDIK